MPMEQLDANPPRKRPEFLTVLCILSFIGSAYGILGGIYKIATADLSKVVTEQFDSAMDKMNEKMKREIRKSENDSLQNKRELAKSAEMLEEVTDFTTNIMHKTNEKVYELATCGIVGGLLCLGGALLMFRLRKIGFYAYITGQVVDYVIPIVLLDAFSMGGFTGSIVTAVMIGTLVIPITLCILYAVNLKHMD